MNKSGREWLEQKQKKGQSRLLMSQVGNCLLAVSLGAVIGWPGGIIIVLINGLLGLIAGLGIAKLLAVMQQRHIKHISKAIAGSGLYLIVMEHDAKERLESFTRDIFGIATNLGNTRSMSFRQRMEFLIRYYANATDNLGWQPYPHQKRREILFIGSICIGLTLLAASTCLLFGGTGMTLYKVLITAAPAGLILVRVIGVLSEAVKDYSTWLGLCELLLDEGEAPVGVFTCDM